MPDYKSITKQPAPHNLLFSICCIATRLNEYELMKSSFDACGFNEDDCEYLLADNSSGNQFDAYEALNRFLQEAKGRYIIVVHQDVRCIDRKSHLTDCLDTLSATDEKWAVCGNAGALAYNRFFFHLNNNGRMMKSLQLPALVHSLDENFLIINRNKQLAVSADLGGFHLYGTDLCVLANQLGYSCYVIPFLVKHLSNGNLGELAHYKKKFVAQYGKKFHRRLVQTPATKFYLGDTVWKNRFYNSAPVFFWVKAIERIRTAIRYAGKEGMFRKDVKPEND